MMSFFSARLIKNYKFPGKLIYLSLSIAACISGGSGAANSTILPVDGNLKLRRPA
jgi:hypothetical protein